MTREETVKNLLTELIDMIDNGSQRDLDRADEIGASIIKLFKQEPCEDCISRQAVKDLYYKNGYIDFRKVCELPPVNTHPKTGYWKKIATYPLYECSKCKLESMLNTWDYCPNCGCRMVEPQESEEKK